jgi:hypothetical protein
MNVYSVVKVRLGLFIPAYLYRKFFSRNLNPHLKKIF